MLPKYTSRSNKKEVYYVVLLYIKLNSNDKSILFAFFSLLFHPSQEREHEGDVVGELLGDHAERAGQEARVAAGLDDPEGRKRLVELLLFSIACMLFG